jgi:hypothetical protein
MEITSFADLLQAACAQPEPQRLLFVFAGSELPEGATAEQRAQFNAGEGGELAPLMCVDKAADELPSFEALTSEAALAGPPWAIVFAAALSGRNGRRASSDEAQAALQHMVDSIKSGRLEGMLPFSRHGEPVHFA